MEPHSIQKLLDGSLKRRNIRKILTVEINDERKISSSVKTWNIQFRSEVT